MHQTLSRLLRLALVVLWASLLSAQDLRYIEYDTDLPSPAECRSRRERLMDTLGREAVAVFYSAPERFRNGDVDYQYRQDNNLYYLTGFTEPNAILVLIPGGFIVRNPEDTSATLSTREIMFVQPRNPAREMWTGRRYGPEGAMKLRGLAYATTTDGFNQLFRQVLATPGLKYLYVPTFRTDFTGQIAELMAPVRNFGDRAAGYLEIRDPTPHVRSMRIVKSAEEIDLITRATQISALAHNQAMMSCEPGMHEYELQAVYEYVFRKMGAEYPGYPCIVGAAENSIVLHYDRSRRRINDGDIVLADCAAEYRGYSSDITRTYPANGVFSKPQREIYQIVLDAQKAAIEMIGPGVSWQAISRRAEEVLSEGLMRLGLLKGKDRRELRRFFMHGLGHPVGLDVHDAGKDVLEPGMIVTVEPGIYIAEGMAGVEPAYYNIGVRIEDVVLITPEGNVVLSADSPREIDAIEALMKQRGIGNLPLR